MAKSQPKLSTTSSLLVKLLDATSAWSRVKSTIVMLALFVMVVATDWVTGVAVNVNVLYMIVCALAVWCLGQRPGMVLAIAAGLATAVIRHVEMGHKGEVALNGPYAEIWNTGARLAAFMFIGIVADALRMTLALERWRGSIDGLTGALNKGAFQHQMTAAVDRARARDGALVMAFIDLDGFKRVNDEHGHSVGDHVLRTLGAGAAREIRSTDLFARMGGDEFAALMEARSCEEGERIVELLHGRLTAILATTGLDVTCSMGALVMSGRDAAFDDHVMERADALMYEVKRAGKNSFRVARGGAVGTMLHSVFQPLDDDLLAPLLGRIDLAERGQEGALRSVA